MASWSLDGPVTPDPRPARKAKDAKPLRAKPKRKPRGYDDPNIIEKAQRLYDAGASVWTVGVALGVPGQTIHQWITVPPERQNPRQPRVELTCAHCKKTFMYVAGELKRRGRKYCSNACQGLSERAQRTCKTCGRTFESDSPKLTCSPACRNKAIGVTKRKLAEGGKMERKGKWMASVEDFCRNCGLGWKLQLHHVVYEQHVRKRGGDEYDPDNSLTLCRTCHARQHSGRARIALSLLRPENIAFAERLLGDYAADYFARFYDDGHPLLELIGEKRSGKRAA